MTTIFKNLIFGLAAILIFAACDLKRIDDGTDSGLQKFSLEISESGKRFYAASVLETADGGYLVAGSLGNEGVFGGEQVHLVKLTKTGAISFQKTLGNGYPNKIISSIEGGYIIVGSDGVAAGNTNALIMKTDANGDLLDSRYINNNGLGFCNLNDVIRSSDGNYIAVGGLESLVWTLKFDPFLSTVWSKTVAAYYAGFLEGLTPSPDANFTATGYAEVASGESYRVLNYKFNISGVELRKTVFGAGTEYDGGADILSLSDGYAVTGYSESNTASTNSVMFAKFDTEFNFLSGNYENTTSNKYTGGRQLIKDTQGNLFITGIRNGSLFLWKTNSSGNTIWIKDFPEGSSGNDLIETSDGGILMVGSKNSGATGGKMIILKTDKDGNL